MNVSVGILLFIAWAAVVAISDCRSRRISNSVVVAGLAAAFACAFLQCGPFGISLTQAAIGALVGFAALLPFFALGVMGAADVKVFAVLGAWCGMHALLDLWMAASLAAGVHALWLLIATRTRLASLVRHHGSTFELAGKASTPYAACLTVSAGAWLVLQGLGGGLR
ncbi:A24 family peptidase [Paraburkholderia sp. SEWSISQ10-3 4]|uniref:A24 family peptidase n=1 Tax=Paraburkholderia TaxID=1822464 RepID=UPI002258A8F4|nr:MULTISPECIES: A24 family peptidase [Paraburkholderia]MCX4141166.1 A24 family peptidase [Paraburkholderia aspalathi]MDN7173849.1 A24 family peptidase [Paraburkholderia sp. SEWSISQ10-3 4]MDQ6503490.1 A24 family peptidase [Paraburkholderia aspalathi]